MSYKDHPEFAEINDSKGPHYPQEVLDMIEALPVSDVQAKMLAALREAVRLYESYGLVANAPECGEWINNCRDVIAQAEKEAHI